ncbi:MAG TPA: endolytic transglycosylase MltG [Candidatus Paceibacterota bacterium]|nr:endolytic transglycosylase MltG [Candidatus Paceibacterota bacterium]
MRRIKLVPPPYSSRYTIKRSSLRFLKSLGLTVLVLGLVGGTALSFPFFLAETIRFEQTRALPAIAEPFPVTVDPHHKVIVENDAVNAFLEGTSSPLQAAAANTGNALTMVFNWIATTLSQTVLYQTIAGANGQLVELSPGMRKEQVASAFGNALGWTATQKQEFLTKRTYSLLPLAEGSFVEGVYVVDRGMSPGAAQALVNDRFSKEVLAHYGTTTAQYVPLEQALTIASLIERETGGPDDMRLISGIIWNRLFTNMNLQIDATLQYAKAARTSTGSWWPKVIPADKSIKSAYNTYAHAGLPPTPIASPSVAAILAALNPKNTSCIFYFHDKQGGFHCSDTYAAHVTALKKYYGRGK